jgi:hypothetical protein
MSGGHPPSIVVKWRDPQSAHPASGRSSRRLRVPLLLGLLAVLIASLAAVLPYFRPRARCHLLPLCVASHRERAFAPLAWRVQDRDGLVGGGYFGSTTEITASTLDQAELVRVLTQLRSQKQDALVVYLAAAARTDAEGQVHLLPADADLDDAATWLPLRRVLELLAQSESRRRLLILDLEPPRVAPRQTVLLDDVAACIPNDLAAVTDGRRLVLCSCSAGQTPLTSEVLKRSVFGHYLEEGLRGWADGSNRGRVTVRELADFVRRRVERWAEKVRQTRQTPVLLGEGSDFTLVDLPNRHPLPHLEIPEEAGYPSFLRDAWKSASGVPTRLRRLSEVEHDWRGGETDEQARLDVQKALNLAVEQTPATPRPRSLAMELKGAAPRSSVVDSLRQVVLQAEARTRGLPPEKANEVRKQLGDDFLKSVKDVPVAEAASAAVDVAIADPRGDAVRFLDALVRLHQPETDYVETLALRRMASADLPRSLVGQVLEIVRTGARTASQPGTFPWVATRLTRAAWKEHEALVVLEAAGFAPRSRAETLLTDCASEQNALLAEQEIVHAARAALADAATLLPEVWRSVESTPRSDAGWLQTANLAIRLSNRLESARDEALAGALGDLRRLSGDLSARLLEIRERFAPDGLAAMIRSSRSATASAGVWRDLNGVLATSLAAGSDREAVWKAAVDVEWRLVEEVMRLDRQAAASTPDAAAEVPSAQQEEQVLRVRADVALALVRLAGLPAVPFEVLRESAGNGDRSALATLETKLRQAWHSLPPGNAGAELWAFLADHYRYLDREYAALQGDSPAAAFYSRAAMDYRPWLKPGREDFAEVTESSNPPQLLPDSSITVDLTVRGVKGGDSEPPMQVRLFAADDEWLDYSPRKVDFPTKSLRALPDGGWLTPIQIEMKPGAGSSTARPKGLLAQVRLDGRAFHRKVPVPLAPAGPEILLVNSDKGLSPLASSIRLRAGAGRQVYHLYVRNPIGKEWKKLMVRLSAGDVTRESEPFELGPNQIQRIVFKPSASVISVTALGTPPTPAAPSAPAPPPALPELNGPLKIAVVDQEGKQEVSSRDVAVDVAAPSEYVEVTQVRFEPVPGNRLSVRLRLRKPLPEPLVSAELVFPPVTEGGATYRDGTLKGNLPAAGEELLLFADNVQAGLDGQAVFHVNVDGWARAFTFRVTLSARDGAATPEQLDGATLRLKVGPYGLAGPDFTAPLEVDNAPAGATVQVSVGRLTGGAFQTEVAATRPSAREKRIGFTPSGPAGVLAFEATVRDWAVVLDTGRIRGPREVRARLLDAQGRELQLAARSVVLGDEAPSEVRFVDPPEKAWRGMPLVLRARGGDAVVGIKEAAFFVGKPVANKAPETATLVPAVPLDQSKSLWGAKLPLPVDGKGPTPISVRFINSVGLTSFATITVDLLEANPALTAKGTIKGTLLEGDRPQAGLDVVLTDEKGAEKAKVKTKADGTFEFTDLAAGKYRVSASKPANGRRAVHPRKAGDFIDLKPGGVETIELTLFL